jgi:hypothetical protein
MGEAPGTKFANVSLSPDNQDLKPSPYYPVSLGKFPVIMGLKMESLGKFLCGLPLAVDSSADLA